MQNFKHHVIKTPYHSILESCDWSDIVNGYFGSSNLYSNYLNDWSESSINDDVAEFLQDQARNLDTDVISDILHNPDAIIRNASYEFYDALLLVFGRDVEKAEYALHHANHWFDSWGKYYVFANADVACLYIIRATNDSEAYQELVTRFESAFSIDESDVENEEDQERNDNGTPINTDYLTLLGSFEFVKP